MVSSSLVSAEGQPGSLRGGHPGVEVAAHRAHALLVRGRREPKAAVRTDGLEQALAVLPGAEQVGRDADPFAQGTDAQIWLVHHP